MMPTQSRKTFPRGFTLTELILAASLTLIVVAFGGWSITAILSSSKRNESQNERRGELNRALEFIASEAREATSINNEASSIAEFNPSASEVAVSSVQEVVRLQIQGLERPVVYYLARPAAANLTWRGPKVIYRWGPDFDKDGNYINANAVGAWSHKPLIDGLEETASLSNCASDWILSPPNPTGFYTCTEKTGRKIAQIYVKGRVNKVLGQAEPYLLTSQAYARSGASSSRNFGRSFEVGNGEVTLTDPATTDIQVLGTAIQCGTNAPAPMKTQLVINKVLNETTTPSTPIVLDPAIAMPRIASYSNEPAGTTFNFTGMVPQKSNNNPNNTCGLENIAGAGGFNSKTTPSQVVILQDGELVPNVAGYGGSRSAKDFVKDYLDASGTRIKLPDPERQYIVLFELGSTRVGSAAFDRQDIVLLASVKRS